MPNEKQAERMTSGKGFIAALDQSGGSTPKALRLYGIKDDAYSSEEEMFDLIHQMRSRIITSPAFTGDRVLGGDPVQQTMDREIAGKPSTTTCGRPRVWCPSSRSTKAWRRRRTTCS